MDLLQWVFQTVEYANERGWITASQAVAVLVFIILHVNNQIAMRNTIELVREQHNETIDAKNEVILAKDQEIETQKEHIRQCDERYALLRKDVNELQAFLNNFLMKQAEVIHGQVS